MIDGMALAWRWLGRLAARVAWSEEWLLTAVNALDGERFWYPKG